VFNAKPNSYEPVPSQHYSWFTSPSDFSPTASVKYTLILPKFDKPLESVPTFNSVEKIYPISEYVWKFVIGVVFYCKYILD